MTTHPEPACRPIVLQAGAAGEGGGGVRCLFSHCLITGCPCEHPERPREEE